MKKLITKIKYNNRRSLLRYDSGQATTSSITITTHSQDNSLFCLLHRHRDTHTILWKVLK